jgi:hypothetical protein
VIGKMKASDQIKNVLTGVTDFEDAQSGIQMSCALHFYQGACEVLKGKDKAARQAKLARLPERVRPYVEKEVVRLWKLRGH